MSEVTREDGLGSASREEMMSALFAHMVVQQSNMALMMLGEVPNPQTGETMRDLEAARMFIDQLEMLEFKTKGNLSKQEEQLLNQSLTGLRMAFVEAIEKESAGSPQPSSSAAATPTPQSKPEEGTPTIVAEATSDEESGRKKFTKKY
jgi:hypothetical protein